MYRKLVLKHSLYTLLVLCCLGPRPSDGHGTLVDPISRNSLWRIDSHAPVNYDDIELFCGGIGVYSRHGNKCGLCGDSIELPSPRPHETGGQMVTNQTVRNYFPGSDIDIIVDLVTNHGGYFEFELCRRESFEEPETEACFERLQFVDGSWRMPLSSPGSGHNHQDHHQLETGYKSIALRMPEGLRECRACVLRWNYVAGNNWGVCPDGTTSRGCGQQELYRNCADISIGYHTNFHARDKRLPAGRSSIRVR